MAVTLTPSFCSQKLNKINACVSLHRHFLMYYTTRHFKMCKEHFEISHQRWLGHIAPLYRLCKSQFAAFVAATQPCKMYYILQ